MSLLDVKNLSVQFDRDGSVVRAVDTVSLFVEPGEIVGLIGESGSGKTTLVRALTGLLPSHAKVAYDCLNIEGGVGNTAMVFQDPLSYLNPSLTIGWQLKETIRCHERQESRKRFGSGVRTPIGSGRMADMRRKFERGRELESRAVDLLELAGIRRAANVLSKYPFELSGGQRQRVVLAIALACKPALLIADEPTTALDVTVQRQILTRLKCISQEMNMAMLLVSHDLGVIASTAERVQVMREGKIVETGRVWELYGKPRHEYTKRLVENAKALAATEGRGDVAEKCMELLRVERVSRIYANKRMGNDGNAFWDRKLNKKTEECVVDDLSFSIRAGECFGLAGESGCGKTTLARMLCGLIRPSAGRIYYHGEELASIAQGRGKEQIRQIQMMFQDPYASLNPCHTAGETLGEVLLLQGMHEKHMRRKEVGRMLLRVGLSEEDMEKYPAAFSGGQRQRIALARALLSNPRLLILDEPVSSLDLMTQHQILELLKCIQEEKKLTYLFISHDLRAIRKMCERLGVMYAGRIVESGNTKDVYEEPWHPYTKVLLESVLSVNPKNARREQGASWNEDGGWQECNAAGCAFARNCGYALERCKREKPETYRFGDREVACFLYSKEHLDRAEAGRKRMRAQI